MSKLSYRIVLKTPEQIVTKSHCKNSLFLKADLNISINSCRQSKYDVVTTHFSTIKKINYIDVSNLYIY